MECRGDVIGMAFNFNSESKCFRGQELAAAELYSEKNSGDDCRGARTETNGERNVVLHVEMHGRKRGTHGGCCALHRSHEQIACIARNLVGIRAAIVKLETGFRRRGRSTKVKGERNRGGIKSASHIGARSGNDSRKNAAA